MYLETLLSGMLLISFDVQPNWKNMVKRYDAFNNCIILATV